MPSYTAKTRNVGRRPRSKRLRELGGSVTINNGSAPDLDGYELLSNKVAEVDSESTDEQYPTAKCLYDALADIATAIEGLSSVFAAIGHVHAIGDITGLQSALDGKAAADHTHSQYLTAHQTVTNKAATIGTSLTTIATIGGTNITAKIGSYAAASHSHAISDITNLQTTLDGKAASSHTHAITDTTGTLPISRGGTGKTTGADACNALLNSLSTGDYDPVDNDYYISQYVNGGTTTTTYHRRPLSKLWNYIKSKADSIYAAASHTHSYLPLSGGTMTGKLTMKASIAFAGTKATNDMIVFIDNTADTYGNGIAIGGGGQTIIGGGESAAAMKAQAGNAGAETMWIGNDGNIEFYPNLQSGWSYGKKSYLDTNGDFYVNRYLHAQYLRATCEAETPTTSSYLMYANSDGYLRKATLANIKTILGLGSAAYTASTAYAAASHTHSYLPLSGGTMSGKTNYFINDVCEQFRPGHANYGMTTCYQTAGNEAMVYALKNLVSSFIFVCGEDSETNHAADRWQSLTPGLQIKNNCVAIGKLIANGVTPTTKLDVSNTAITTTGTAVLNVNGDCPSPTTSIAVYGLKVTLTAGTGTPPDNTNSAAIYAVGSFGYAGLFSGGVKVSGSLLANSVSATTIYQTSDDRLKNYVGEFHFALADLERIPLRFFTFKNDPDKRVLIGTSAQAVQKVLPEIVGSSRTASEEDSEEYLNVDYSKLALVALDCVRQLRDEVAALRREIDELKRGR